MTDHVRNMISLLTKARNLLEEEEDYICYALSTVVAQCPDLQEAYFEVDMYVMKALGNHDYFSSWIWTHYSGSDNWPQMGVIGNRGLRIIWVERMIHSLEERGVLP